MAYQHSHIVAKQCGDLLGGGGSILNGIVQQAGNLYIDVSVHIGENLQHFQRMQNVG